MSNSITNHKDLLINVTYVVVSYQRLRDSCDWYYLLKIVRDNDATDEKIIIVTSNDHYVYDKIEKIISGKITVPRLVISKSMHQITNEVKLYCGGDIAWVPLPVRSSV